MIKRWRVSVQLARDDHVPLSDEGIERLIELLADDLTVVDREDAGVALVQLTVDATNGWAARSAAEDKVRAAADDVWAALDLPPFTITFAQIAPEGAG
jgi:hypothetical protein